MIGHAVYREARGRPAWGAIDLADTADRFHGFYAVDPEARHAMVDQLGHRSAVGGDD
jgi:hypothetical protein